MVWKRIELVGVPVGKGRPRAVRRGAGVGVFTPQKTRDYEANLRAAAQAAMNGEPPTLAMLSVVITAYMPIPASMPKRLRAGIPTGDVRPAKKPDIDNLVKVLDALNEVVWKDDSQIVECQVAKFYDERPRFVIAVTEL